jgi:hypothetical protein
VLQHARHVCQTAPATCCPLHIPHVASVKVWRNFDRERYRKAAELSRVRGKLSCLLINDLDAGLGHFANTQVTVNNQARSATPDALPLLAAFAPSWLLPLSVRPDVSACCPSQSFVTDVHDQRLPMGYEAFCACYGQNSVGTLMNIADDPTQVSGGGTWRVNDTLRRIPIILTGEHGKRPGAFNHNSLPRTCRYPVEIAT